jgi:hypothetical protein
VKGLENPPRPRRTSQVARHTTTTADIKRVLGERVRCWKRSGNETRLPLSRFCWAAILSWGSAARRLARARLHLDWGVWIVVYFGYVYVIAASVTTLDRPVAR